MNAIPNALQFAQEHRMVEGKTVGIKVPTTMRARLDAVQAQYKLATVKQTVLFVLYLGLRQLEGTEK